jgi:hypothetical protein
MISFYTHASVWTLIIYAGLRRMTMSQTWLQKLSPNLPIGPGDSIPLTKVREENNISSCICKECKNECMMGKQLPSCKMS